MHTMNIKGMLHPWQYGVLDNSRPIEIDLGYNRQVYTNLDKFRPIHLPANNHCFFLDNPELSVIPQFVDGKSVPFIDQKLPKSYRKCQKGKKPPQITRFSKKVPKLPANNCCFVLDNPELCVIPQFVKQSQKSPKETQKAQRYSNCMKISWKQPLLFPWQP